MHPPIVLTGAVEGPVDEVVLRRVASEIGVSIGDVYVTEGVQKLFQRLPGFNAAAQFEPWVVLVDLDSVECPPELLSQRLPTPSAKMHFRIAVRAIEAWLLADSEGAARFLSVSEARIPREPDELVDPKQALVNLARRSRSRAIRADVVPGERSGRRVGPAYEARLIEFASAPDGCWNPTRAAQRSESLRRCIAALR